MKNLPKPVNKNHKNLYGVLKAMLYYREEKLSKLDNINANLTNYKGWFTADEIHKISVKLDRTDRKVNYGQDIGKLVNKKYIIRKKQEFPRTRGNKTRKLYVHRLNDHPLFFALLYLTFYEKDYLYFLNSDYVYDNKLTLSLWVKVFLSKSKMDISPSITGNTIISASKYFKEFIENGFNIPDSLQRIATYFSNNDRINKSRSNALLNSYLLLDIYSKICDHKVYSNPVKIALDNNLNSLFMIDKRNKKSKNNFRHKENTLIGDENVNEIIQKAKREVKGKK